MLNTKIEPFDTDISFDPQPAGYLLNTNMPGHGKRHPDQDVVFSTINNRKRNNGSTFYDDVDPDVIAKLKRSVLRDRNDSRTTKTEVAYNDIGAYRPDRIRPFNNVDSIISQAQVDSGRLLNDSFDNTYYRLWTTDEQREADLVMKRAADIEKLKLKCINFKNINQCMSVCSNTDDCTGFYIDGPNKCCMMVDPPYAANRHSYDILPNNIDAFSHRTLNNLIRRAEQTEGKIVFDHIRSDDGNRTYKVDMDRSQCKSLCPKCIMGKCPNNYRCANMTADPRYNYSCIITNEDRYDENKNYTFDSPNVPVLDEKYGLNEYAGYDTQNSKPIFNIPESERLRVDDRIVPTQSELQTLYRDYDAKHIGPHTCENNTPIKAPVEHFQMFNYLGNVMAADQTTAAPLDNSIYATSNDTCIDMDKRFINYMNQENNRDILT